MRVLRAATLRRIVRACIATALVGFAGVAAPTHALAVSMRSHGRGGIVLVVPPDSESWKESIVQPITYAAVPPYSALAKLSRPAVRR